MIRKPEYGNWVSKRLVYTPFAVGIVFLLIAAVFQFLIVPPLSFFSIPSWLFLSIPTGLFFFLSIYFAYARHLFSSTGGNVQNKVLGLVLANLDWNGRGRALDIGCGNASLTVKLAQKYKAAHVVGIDYWGGNWEYSKKTCEENAKIEGVNKRVTFQKASASAMPFNNAHFDAAVSNLVFHEVRDTSDKREVVREALRVVKKGGKFAFQDLFLTRRMYGDTEDLVKTIRSWGIRKVKFIETRNSAFIPRALKLSFMLGTMGIIAGEK